MRMARMILIVVAALAGGCWPGTRWPVAAPRTDAHAPPGLAIAAAADGLRIDWGGDIAGGDPLAGDPLAGAWPLVEIGSALVPARLITVRVLTAAPVMVRIGSVESHEWPGAVDAIPAPIPRSGDGPPRPDLRSAARPALPPAPVIVLREGRVRGTRLAVLAISPRYAAAGRNRSASAFSALIPGVAPLDATDAADLWREPAAPFVADAAPPWNPAANGPAWRIIVTAGGIQQISGAALAGDPLAGAGLATGSVSPANLRLWRDGAEVALEERGTADGRLDAGDTLRFYAPPPGDRWNAGATYWLSLESAPGLRMATCPISATAAPGRDSALQRGVWRANSVYDSVLPGADGDHWYAADLRAGPGLPASGLAFALTPTLPLAPGSVALTVTGAAYTAGQHRLETTLGGALAGGAATWTGTGAWTATFALSTTATLGALRVLPGAAPDGIEPDGVAWSRPVGLDFGGGAAAFSGVAGHWRYDLRGLPAERTLYDISDRSRPVIVELAGGAEASFVAEDPFAGGGEYLLTDSASPATPAVAPFAPTDWTARADAIYVAPPAFHAALAPLTAHRARRGSTTLVVDPAAIYAAWSGGDVDPAAIRAFLRYAAATWSPAPLAVILVGDGTSDPLNYLGRNNPTIVPPLLAQVDPWLGETACETCYAQLDGASPLDDSLPDLLIGRLPVNRPQELSAAAAKIVGYETAPAIGAWRGAVGLVADNFRDAQGQGDGAGDFAAFADALAALQPAGIAVERVYYDPWRRDAQGAPLADPWREADALAARAKTLALLDAGAGIVSYVGHSHQWQWAITDPALATPYLLSLYDIDGLSNGGRLPVLLEMTCLTSAFQQPSFSGTTLDERFVIHPGGGAVATWGSTGLGVAHGHDALSRGFYRALWDEGETALGDPLLGVAVNAGYLELFGQGGCCQDSLRTYAVFGDPLMPLRLRAAERNYLPSMITDH